MTAKYGIFGRKKKSEHIIDAETKANKSSGKDSEFKYNTANDNAYQSYKESYERQADAGLKNVLGNMASMTGGIPSSYAGTSAGQAYSKTMSGLYEKVPQLIDAAYSRYNYDRMARLDEDKFNADRNDEKYKRYADERDFNYTRYDDQRDYEYKNSRDKASDEQWEKTYNRESNNDAVKNKLSAKKQQLEENKFSMDKANNSFKNQLEMRKQKYKENSFDYTKTAGLIEECINSGDTEKWLSENAKYLTAEEYLWIISNIRNKQ